MWRRGDYMKWEEIYQLLSIQERMIIDIAEAYKVDLTELANLLVQKQENGKTNQGKIVTRQK